MAPLLTLEFEMKIDINAIYEQFEELDMPGPNATREEWDMYRTAERRLERGVEREWKNQAHKLFPGVSRVLFDACLQAAMYATDGAELNDELLKLTAQRIEFAKEVLYHATPEDFERFSYN